MSQKINFGFRLANADNEPLDGLYGPWLDINEFTNFVGGDLSNCVVGTTIGIIENGSVVEYWNPTAPNIFVVKQTSGLYDTVGVQNDL